MYKIKTPLLILEIFLVLGGMYLIFTNKFLFGVICFLLTGIIYLKFRTLAPLANTSGSLQISSSSTKIVAQIMIVLSILVLLYSFGEDLGKYDSSRSYSLNLVGYMGLIVGMVILMVKSSRK